MATINDYNTESFTYPADVMSDEYGGNFAMFFINVQSDSKLSMPTIGGVDTGLGSLSGVTTGLNTGLTNIGAAHAAVNSAAEAFITGGIGTAIVNLFSSKGSMEALKAAGGAGAIAGAISGVAAMGSGEFSAPVKRLKTAIALHMPTSLNIRYSVNYEEVDTVNMAGMNELTSFNLGNTFDAATNKALGASINSGAIQKLSKTAPNPMKEQIFRTVDFRTFTFSYRFAPRNEKEASNALNIINQFKFHMYPEFKDKVGFNYIFPSEFDVVYYSGGNENDKIHKHTSCVLTEAAVNYTPNGVFTTFPNGMPTQIEMQLTFKELVSLDKDKIKTGGF